LGKRLGIFGGTFDPPHVGHLILAMEALDQMALDQVLWVIAPDPPHKHGKKIAPLETRISMVKAAMEDDPTFEISYIDIDRPGPHYVLDTMLIVRDRYPEDERIFVMGGDSLHSLADWYKPAEFISLCDEIGVMRRPGETLNIASIIETLPELKAKIEFIDAPLLEISSNQIRHLIQSNKPYRYYLPKSVYNIVEKLGLYREGENAVI